MNLIAIAYVEVPPSSNPPRSPISLARMPSLRRALPPKIHCRPNRLIGNSVRRGENPCLLQLRGAESHLGSLLEPIHSKSNLGRLLERPGAVRNIARAHNPQYRYQVDLRSLLRKGRRGFRSQQEYQVEELAEDMGSQM